MRRRNFLTSLALVPAAFKTAQDPLTSVAAVREELWDLGLVPRGPFVVSGAGWIEPEQHFDDSIPVFGSHCEYCGGKFANAITERCVSCGAPRR